MRELWAKLLRLDGPPLRIGPRTTRERARALAPAALVCAALVLGLHTAALRSGAVLGAAGTDALRAAWGLDHVAEALPWPPWWTDRVGWPAGVKLLVLPGFSSLVGAPLHAVLGPIHGFTAWILLMLWLSAMATATLVERVTRCGAAAMLAGVVTILQPVTLMAVSDGTAEHVAFWALPAMLASFVALSERDATGRTAVVTGALAAVMAFDSPYNVVFALPFLPLVAQGVPLRRLLQAGGVALAGAGLIALAYAGFDTTTDDARRAENAIRVATWTQWEINRIAETRPWEFTVGTGFTPVGFLLGATALAALRPLRAAPWLVMATLCLLMGLGPGEENARELARLFGNGVGDMAAAVAAFHRDHPVPIVRFPRRWLLPLAIALATGAGVGLTRLRDERVRWAVAATLSLGMLALTLEVTGYHRAPPVQVPLQPAFAAFVRDHDQDGAVLVLPRQRGAREAATRRDQLPVFAGLGADLASSDGYWIQLLLGRATTFKPVGLRTMVERWRMDDEDGWLLQGLDDLAIPQTLGREVPPSATGEVARRQKAAQALRDDGLAFVVLDSATMGEDGVRLARDIFAPLLAEERHFDDGTGVDVWVLKAP